MRKIDEIFSDRTCYKFLPKSVDKELLKEIYDIMKLGSTSFNSSPLRITFVESDAEKETLCNCLLEANIPKARSAPVVAIFAYDTKFYEFLPKLLPIMPEIKDYFASSEEISLDNAIRNSTLQAAYFMTIARGFGLDCGPMSGFNKDAVNKAFFSKSNYKVNFLCNIGYKDGENPYPRLPRLDFNESCVIL